MIIDKSPEVNNNIITVEHEIDISEDITIFLNGVIVLLPDDIDYIEYNKIILYPNIDINYNDEFFVFYTKKIYK